MQASLTHIHTETDDITTYHFQPMHPLDHIAGQYIEMTIAHTNTDLKGASRWFTLSSSPTEKDIAITVRQSQSSFKRALHRLKPGDQVHISQPQGDFVLPLDDSTPLVWIAAGIGITPFRSMAKWLADYRETSESRKILIFHSIAQPREALFTDILKSAGITRHLHTTSTGSRITPAEILRADVYKDAMFYISGPEPFTESFAKGLQHAGLPAYRVVTDAFLGYS